MNAVFQNILLCCTQPSSDDNDVMVNILLNQEISSFYLKEAFHGFSCAYLHCHHHYSCTLGSLLSEVRVT